MQDDNNTTPPGGGGSDTGAVSAAGSGDAEESRAREEAARFKLERDSARQDLQRALPAVQIANAIWKIPGGQQIIEKLQKGEKLTAIQEAKVEGAIEKTSANNSNGSVRALTADELDAKLEKFKSDVVDTLAADREAVKNIETLHTRAATELDGYDEIRKSPKWKTTLAVVMAQIQNGDEVVPDGDNDPVKQFDHGIRRTYEILVASDPKFQKAKEEAAQKNANRNAASKLAGSPKPSSASGSKGSNEETPPEIAMYRNLKGTFGVGKSYSNPARNKR